jgi:hypothetical protein
MIPLDTACNKNQPSKQPVILTAVKKITQFNDTTFFRDMSSMLLADSSLYVDGTDKIYRLGPHMRLTGSMGRKGKGPGEFTAITDMDFVNDSLYVYDRIQAKILVYDANNHFAREIGVQEAYSFSFAVDRQDNIFLSTPQSNHLITELDAHDTKIRTFGQNTIEKNSPHFERNGRMLFIHNKDLIAVGKSEPLVAVYHLNGTLIHKTRIDPRQIRGLITAIKKKNKGPLKHPHFKFLAILFNDAAMYKNNLYLMATKVAPPGHSFKKKYVFVFKYKLESNGDLTFERAFKLFRPNHKKLLYGLRLAVGKHKLFVFDMQSGALFEFKDSRL